MTEQQRREFAGELLVKYGLHIHTDNELLPILYIMHSSEKKLAHTIEKVDTFAHTSEQRVETALQDFSGLLKQVLERPHNEYVFSNEDAAKAYHKYKTAGQIKLVLIIAVTTLIVAAIIIYAARNF